jgi:hypothetical protein
MPPVTVSRESKKPSLPLTTLTREKISSTAQRCPTIGNRRAEDGARVTKMARALESCIDSRKRVDQRSKEESVTIRIAT